MMGLVVTAGSLLGFVMGGLLGSNERSKALLGIGYSWMATGQILGSCVGPRYGLWARIGCVVVVPVILVAAAVFRRDWFKGAGADYEPEKPRPG